MFLDLKITRAHSLKISSLPVFGPIYKFETAPIFINCGNFNIDQSQVEDMFPYQVSF